MLILTFEEFNNKFNIDNNAMSDIRIKDIGKDISLTPIEIVMRDQTPDSIGDPNFNIIVNLHPTEGTHWVLFMRREGGPTYYFNKFIFSFIFSIFIPLLIGNDSNYSIYMNNFPLFG